MFSKIACTISTFLTYCCARAFLRNIFQDVFKDCMYTFCFKSMRTSYRVKCLPFSQCYQFLHYVFKVCERIVVFLLYVFKVVLPRCFQSMRPAYLSCKMSPFLTMYVQYLSWKQFPFLTMYVQYLLCNMSPFLTMVPIHTICFQKKKIHDVVNVCGLPIVKCPLSHNVCAISVGRLWWPRTRMWWVP